MTIAIKMKWNNTLVAGLLPAALLAGCADELAGPVDLDLSADQPAEVVPVDPDAKPNETSAPQVADGDDKTPRGYYLRSAIWQRFDIKVCWETAGWTTEKGWVKAQVEADWEGASGVNFFGWATCDDDDMGIRIRIADENPLVHALGDGLDGMKNGMVLNFKFDDWGSACKPSSKRRNCIETIALHEFGHALGLAHEHNRPDRGSFPSCTDDPQGTNGDVLVGQFDTESIMNYCYDASYSGKLSAGDKTAIKRMYPEFGDDVGVIPAAGDDCPVRHGDGIYGNEDRITLRLDDEDKDNNNQRAGWIGGTVSNENTEMTFCRVDGSAFKHFSSGSSRNHNYAVVMLGRQCPNGSVQFTRHFDNEDKDNNNKRYGDIRPILSSRNTTIRFCLFQGTDDPARRASGSSLPSIAGLTYGVFASSDWDHGSEPGWFYTDDEDEDNKNRYSGDADGRQMVQSDENTKLFVWRR